METVGKNGKIRKLFGKKWIFLNKKIFRFYKKHIDERLCAW